MKALIDGDILRYEVGFAAEAGWKKMMEERGIEDDLIPSLDYVVDMLDTKLANILAISESDEYTLYLTEGRTFRDNIAVTKPYKGTRKPNKPYHFDNITAYMKGVMDHEVVTGIEADDAMAIESTLRPQDTVICSRDKDLRQVPGRIYSWELGKQPSFGPKVISTIGSIQLSDNRKKVTGDGFTFFCAQLLMGDGVDNIPGLAGCGPVRAYDLLASSFKCESDVAISEELLFRVSLAYKETFEDDWEIDLLEQGQLLWIVRRLNEDGTPELWYPGLYK